MDMTVLCLSLLVRALYIFKISHILRLNVGICVHRALNANQYVSQASEGSRLSSSRCLYSQISGAWVSVRVRV